MRAPKNLGLGFPMRRFLVVLTVLLILAVSIAAGLAVANWPRLAGTVSTPLIAPK